MDGVNETSTSDVGGQYEDGTCEQTGAGTDAGQTDVTDTTGVGQVDTLETMESSTGNDVCAQGVDPHEQALRDELASNNQRREELKPELEKAREEALWQLPKALPEGGLVSDVARGFKDSIQAKGDFETTDNAAGALSDSVAGEAAEHMAEAMAERIFEDNPTSRLAAGTSAVGGVIDFVNKAKDGYDITKTQIDYGKVIKEDEGLMYRNQDIQMELDPSASFEFTKIGANDFSRKGNQLTDADGNAINPTGKPIDGRVIDATGRTTATDSDRERIEGILRRQGIKL